MWFFEGEVKDGKGEVAGKGLMAIYDNGKALNEVNSAILWDFVPSDDNEQIKVDITKEKVQEYTMGAAESYKQEIVEERKRQVEGEKVELAIRNKEERKRQYEEALKTLQKEIEQEVSLAISMPKFLGVVLIKPEFSEKVSSKEMKEIGREFVKRYEREHGREPTDVPDGYGYDLISKTKRFKEQYWLYVVANVATSPTLYIINNPAEKLNAEEKIEVIRFLIPSEEWKNKGVKA